MFFIEKYFYKKITKNYEWPIMEECHSFSMIIQMIHSVFYFFVIFVESFLSFYKVNSYEDKESRGTQ